MRRDRGGEAHAVARVGARQRHEVLHRGVRDDAAVLDVLLNGVGQRAHQTEASRHPAHAAIKAAGQQVERDAMLVMERAEQPPLLERTIGGIRAQELPKDQSLRLRHLPRDGGDQVPVQLAEAADAFVPIDHDVAGRRGHDHDGHLLSRVRQRCEEAPLPRELSHAEPLVAQIQLMKFQLHRPRPGPSRAPDVPNRPTPPAQLRTRPPTDDAALPRDRPPHDRRHRCESVELSRAEGTLIHHATARAIRPLMVAMIEPSFRTLLMAPARRAD
jgi:hypothetical protein